MKTSSTQIANDFLTNHTTTLSDEHVFLALAHWSKNDIVYGSGSIGASLKELAHLAGYHSVSHVTKLVKQLVEAGWVEAENSKKLYRYCRERSKTIFSLTQKGYEWVAGNIGLDEICHLEIGDDYPRGMFYL